MTDELRVMSVRDLSVHFPVKKGLLRRTTGAVRAVDGISFDLYKGQTLGLVGESGCGKTTVAKALVGLVPASGGEVFCGDVNLLNCSREERKVSRRTLQMIFQDPFSSLDPKMSIGNIIGEAVKFHRPEENCRALVEKYLELTGLRPEYFDRYPHEFSGGQRQRIGIARALATRPEIVVADEPVSALDVSVQARVLNLMKRLQQRLGLSYLFITHDLSVVNHISHRVAVMYLGTIVEIFPVSALRGATRHPYTRALIAAIPSIYAGPRKQHAPITGEIPSPMNLPTGCPFHTRCLFTHDRCRIEKPALEEVASEHRVACHRWRELEFAPALRQQVEVSCEPS